MDGQLGLDLEARREHGHGLGEYLVVGAVARHDVGELEAVDGLDQEAHQVVAEAVEGAVVLLAVGAVREAVAHHHVGLVGEKRREQGRGGLGGVGVVAVDHEVGLGVDVAHHLAHDVALALAALHLDDSPVGACDVAGAVGGVVVVDVHGRLGQHAAEVVDHLADGDGLVVAGYDDGHAFAREGGLVGFSHRALLRES